MGNVYIGEEDVKRAKSDNFPNILFFGGQYVLRAFGLCLCLSALLLMLKSDQSFYVVITMFHARYTYSIAFKFLALVDLVVCCCSIVSLLYVFLLSCYPKPHTNFYFMLFLHDLFVSLLMVGGCAAGTAIGYVGKYGQSKSGWSPICNRASKFCNKMTISIGLSYIGLICYIMLTFLAVLKIKYSSYKGN